MGATKQHISRTKAYYQDALGKGILGVLAGIASLIIVAIVIFIWLESIPALSYQGTTMFFDSYWNPAADRYGILTFIAGTFWVSGLAIILAVPLGLLGAVFLAEYCPKRVHHFLRLCIEMMAAIPSIVYGLWAMVVLVPVLRNFWQPLLTNLFWWTGLFSGDAQGYGVLAGGLILSAMLLPTVIAISEDALHFVPTNLREASLALGASRTETAFKVVVSTALPGIGAAVLLALGRAIGETMAILMVTGNTLWIPLGFNDKGYALTSIIANQLGYAYNDPLYRSALFVCALMLLIMSILFTGVSKLLLRRAIKQRGVTH